MNEIIMPEEFARQMHEIADGGTQRLPREYIDTEARHCDADDFMCEVLQQLGYGEGVSIFKNMKKWYA